MTTAIAKTDADAVVIEQALIGGDLSRLTPAQRVSYYNQVCQSLELNPLTKPFAYIVLNGKLVLYALKDCTEQLRNRRQISVSIAAREVVEDVYVVTARATTPAGRTDESIGAVPLAGLKGEARANAMMKAETKSKRRVTLSICGLGILDETEVENIPSAAPYVVEAPAAQPVPSLPEARMVPPAQSGGDSGHSDLITVKQVRPKTRGSAGEITLSTGEAYVCYREQIVALAEQCCQNGDVVEITTKRSASGNEYLVDLRRKPAPAPVEPLSEPISSDEIPF